MRLILFSLILTVLTMVFEFVYVKIFDNEELDSGYYIIFALLSLIPLVNFITLLAAIILNGIETFKLICGPVFEQLSFKLDTFRKRNNDIRIQKRLTTENELNLLKQYLIDTKIFNNRFEINDFLMSLKVCKKLED